MRRFSIPMLAIAAVVCANASAFSEPVDLSGGLPWYTTVKTWQAGTMEAAMSQAAAATTIPLWSYAVNSSRDGNTYTGTMVGRSPFYNGARETDIPTFIIPVKVVMPDTGHVFDPTAEDPFGCLPAGDTALGLTQQSPIFDAPASDWIMNGVDVGTGQYVDAFQRAAFFSDVSVTGDRYHTVLSPVTTLSTVTFNVSAGSGATYTRGCGMIGVVDITAMDFFVRTEITALAAQGVHPTTFPLFLLYNVVMGDPGDSITSNCCVIGYHGAGGAPLQTYSPTDFDSTGIFRHLANTSVFAHEVGEWMNDPTGSNPTPKWGHTGQVSGCQNNLEVGDPLSGTLFPSVTMPNGYTYDLQELAFFSWFYGSPSLGAGGFFSNNETFGSDAGQVCS